MTRADRWLRRYFPAPHTVSRLICFPHAGGSASFYRPLAGALAADTEVLIAQYPGRQERRSEPGLTDIGVLADRLFEAITSLPERTTVLFGHSMGALVGFEVASRLQAAGLGAEAFVVSGRRAPSRHRDEQVHRYSQAALLAELRLLSGTEMGILDDDEIVEMILPALRTDYEALETYRYHQKPPLAAPILALIGDRDPRVDIDEVDDWARHTSGGFERRVFPGGHFFLTAHQEAVVAALRERVAAVSSGWGSRG